MILAGFLVWTILLTIGIVVMVVVLAYRFSLLYKRMARARASNSSYMQKNVDELDSQVKHSTEFETPSASANKKPNSFMARIRSSKAPSTTSTSPSTIFDRIPHTGPDLSSSASSSGGRKSVNIDAPVLVFQSSGASSF